MQYIEHVMKKIEDLLKKIENIMQNISKKIEYRVISTEMFHESLIEILKCANPFIKFIDYYLEAIY